MARKKYLVPVCSGETLDVPQRVHCVYPEGLSDIPDFGGNTYTLVELKPDEMILSTDAVFQVLKKLAESVTTNEEGATNG